MTMTTNVDRPVPGQLMVLAPGMIWHNAFVVHPSDPNRVISEMRFTRSDAALYVSTHVNSNGGTPRYVCLVGGLTAKFNPECLVDLEEASE